MAREASLKTSTRDEATDPRGWVFDLKRFAELVTERGMGDFPHRMLPRRGLAQAKL